MNKVIDKGFRSCRFVSTIVKHPVYADPLLSKTHARHIKKILWRRAELGGCCCQLIQAPAHDYPNSGVQRVSGCHGRPLLFQRDLSFLAAQVLATLQQLSEYEYPGRADVDPASRHEPGQQADSGYLDNGVSYFRHALARKLVRAIREQRRILGERAPPSKRTKITVVTLILRIRQTTYAL